MNALLEIETWLELLNQYKELGIIIPILLAFVESFIPALPLIGIVAINITAHGFLTGFITSYLGNVLGSIIVFLFFRTIIKQYFIDRFYHGIYLAKILHWVENQKPIFLFFLSSLAFTPSAFINMSFGLSGYKKRQFFISIALGKFFMILSLSLFGQSLSQIQNQPMWIIISVLILVLIYFLSKYLNHKSNYHKIHKD